MTYVVPEIEVQADKLYAECCRRWSGIKWLLVLWGQTGHYGFSVEPWRENALALLEKQIRDYQDRLKAELAAVSEV